MFLVEKDPGDVIALSHQGVETRITVVESRNGRFILAIDAPPDTYLKDIVPVSKQGHTDLNLRKCYRHELLMY